MVAKLRKRKSRKKANPAKRERKPLSGAAKADRKPIDDAMRAELRRMWLQDEPKLPLRRIARTLGISEDRTSRAAVQDGLPPRAAFQRSDPLPPSALADPDLPVLEHRRSHPHLYDSAKARARSITSHPWFPMRVTAPVIHRTCQWIKEKGKPYTFCGEECLPGKPYCAEHCGVAYVAEKPKTLTP